MGQGKTIKYKENMEKKWIYYFSPTVVSQNRALQILCTEDLPSPAQYLNEHSLQNQTKIKQALTVYLQVSFGGIYHRNKSLPGSFQMQFRSFLEAWSLLEGSSLKWHSQSLVKRHTANWGKIPPTNSSAKPPSPRYWFRCINQHIKMTCESFQLCSVRACCYQSKGKTKYAA